MGRKAGSLIWKFFKKDTDGHAMCDNETCTAVIKRPNGSTSSMIGHLRRQRPTQFEAYLEQLKKDDDDVEMTLKNVRGDENGEDAGTSRNKEILVRRSASIHSDTPLPKKQRQLTLSETIARSEKYTFNSIEADKFNKMIAELLISEYLPSKLVESIAFRRLVQALNIRYEIPSRNYFVQTVIPDIVRTMKETVRREIENVEYFSFTTDTWSHNGAAVALLSLTSHWIDENFTRKNVVLAGQPFNEAHTGGNIMDKLKLILTEWKIPMSSVHIFVRDGGSNIVCALNRTHLNVNSVHCLAHKLQLVIRDSIFSQPSVKEIVLKGRKFAKHFHHSVTASEALKEIQTRLGLKQHSIIHDCEMRWNSTFEMLARIKEQTTALHTYVIEREANISPFTKTDIEVIEKIILVLEPFAKKMKELSFDDACISMYIPMVKSLIATISELLAASSTMGVKSTLRSMLDSIKGRFDDLDWDCDLIIATLLDPRFKNASKLLTTDYWARAIERLRREASEGINNSDISSGTSHKSNTTPDARSSSISDFWNFDSSSASTANSDDVMARFEKEFLSYEAAPRPSMNTSPFDWWRVSRTQFPILAHLARRYLAAPPTSVASERLFSMAGLIYNSKKRNRLLKEKAADYLFVKANLSRLNFNY